MVTNKYITKIISALMALAVILCLATSAFSKQLQAVYGNNAVTMEYETELFDTDQVMDIDILMDEDDWNVMLENEEYLAKYHEYLNELVEKYVNGGEFQKTYERIRSQIDELVAEDPTAFYSYEEYEAAVEMLYEVINLRGESVSGQLDGTIPSTDDGQKADSSTLIDGSGIELSVMGSMSMGGGAGEGIGVPGGRGDGGQMRAPGGSVDEQQTGVPGGSVDK